MVLYTVNMRGLGGNAIFHEARAESRALHTRGGWGAPHLVAVAGVFECDIMHTSTDIVSLGRAKE